MTAPAELWRVSVRTSGPSMPDVLEQFEEEALSVSVFEIEDEVEVLRSQLREQYLQEKKKTVAEWEERLRNALADRAVREQEND